VVLVLILGVSGTATASPIVNGVGLSAPDYTVTFDEIVFPGNTHVNAEYSAYGVTFSNLVYDTGSGSAPYAGIAGHYLGNFDPVVNPFSIYFATPQRAAAFAMAARRRRAS